MCTIASQALRAFTTAPRLPCRYELFKENLAIVRRNVIYNVYQFQPAKMSPQQLENAKVASGEQDNGGGNGAAAGKGTEKQEDIDLQRGEKFQQKKAEDKKAQEKQTTVAGA